MSQRKHNQDDLNKLAQLLANTFALPRLIHGAWSNVIMLDIMDIGDYESTRHCYGNITSPATTTLAVVARVI
jgi:hypothetical protein